MRYMLIYKSTEDNEAGVPPTPEQLQRIGRLTQDMVASGKLLAAEGLRASSKGAAKLTVVDGKRTVTDGPYAEAKELIAGFAIVEVEGKDEAVELAARFAEASGATELEVRQVGELSDFDL